jgi:predicted Zn-dependent protease
MVMRLLFLLLVLPALTGCATFYNPASERGDFVFINTGSEVALGKMVDDSVRKQYHFSGDTRFNERVNNIGRQIAAVCDRKDLEYKFFVIDDKELNAFSIPGGYVYVNTALLARANDDELAGVMAHEIGHVVARHAVKHLQTQLGFDIVMSIALNQSSATQAAGVMFNLISLGYSRGDERQADKLAVIYAFKAKYDPRGLLTFFAKLKEEEKKEGTANIPVFLRSHPALDERIKNIGLEIAKVEAPPATSSAPAPLTAAGNKSVVALVKPASAYQLAAVEPVAATPANVTRKMCPLCKRVYSGQDNFCPYDGRKLVF